MIIYHQHRVAAADVHEDNNTEDLLIETEIFVIHKTIKIKVVYQKYLSQLSQYYNNITTILSLHYKQMTC